MSTIHISNVIGSGMQDHPNPIKTKWAEGARFKNPNESVRMTNERLMGINMTIFALSKLSHTPSKAATRQRDDEKFLLEKLYKRLRISFVA